MFMQSVMARSLEAHVGHFNLFISLSADVLIQVPLGMFMNNMRVVTRVACTQDPLHIVVGWDRSCVMLMGGCAFCAAGPSCLLFETQ